MTRERKAPHSSYIELFSPKYRNMTILASVPRFLMDIATYDAGIFIPILLCMLAFS